MSDKDRYMYTSGTPAGMCYMFVGADAKQCKSAWLLSHSHAWTVTPLTYLYSLALFLWDAASPNLSRLFIRYFPLPRTILHTHTNTVHQLALSESRCQADELFSAADFLFYSVGSWVTAVSRVRVFKALSRLTGWGRWGCRDGHFHHLLLSKLIMEQLNHAASPLESQTASVELGGLPEKVQMRDIGCHKGSA